MFYRVSLLKSGRVGIGIPAVLLFLSCNSPVSQNNSDPTGSLPPAEDSIVSRLFTVRDGFGFDVLLNGRVYIHQPVIPCQSGYHVFATREQAGQLARFIVNRLQTGRFRFLLVRKDVDSILALPSRDPVTIDPAQTVLPSGSLDFLQGDDNAEKLPNETTSYDSLPVLRDMPLKKRWRKLANVPFGQRGGLMNFVMGSGIYLGGGDDKDMTSSDFWRYDAGNDYWTCLADLPGGPRIGGVMFSVAGKGYVTLGGFRGGNSKSFKKDLYAYDPSTNEWQRKKDFPGGPRVDASGFVIGNKAYVGTGYDEDYFADMYEYDPAADRWKRIADFGPGPISASIGISTGSGGFMIAGDHVPENKKFAYAFLPKENAWRRLADFPGKPRYFLTGYNIDSEKFIAGAGGAEGGEVRFRDFFLYDCPTNSWSPLPDYPSGKAGNSRPSGGSVNGRIFMGTGYNGNYLKDWNVFEYYYSVNPRAGTYDESGCYPMRYDGHWDLFQECDSLNCYAGAGLNSNTSLGDFCYRRKLAEGLRKLPQQNENAATFFILPRNFVISCKKTIHQPVLLRLFFPKKEIVTALNDYREKTGSAPSLNDISILQCNESSPDLDPFNNSFQKESFSLTRPQWFSYGYQGEILVAEFPVTSLHSEFYLAIPF